MRSAHAMLYGVGVFLALALIDLAVWHFYLIPALFLAALAALLAAASVRFPNTGAAIALVIVWILVVPWTLAFTEIHWREPGRTIIAWLALGGHAVPAFGPFLLRAINPARYA